MGTTIPPPRLATLDTKPSWHNRAGRVDRSACFVLSAMQSWRRVHADDWTYRYAKPPPDTWGSSRGQPTYAPWLKGKVDRYATLTYWARDLWTLHKFEQPYPLQGDFRSTKSNALRAHILRDQSTRHEHEQRNDAVLGQGPINPNRGVGFNHHKMLGLDCMWQTTIRIERYVQHAKLKQHFLVCPVCGHNTTAAMLRIAGPATRGVSAISHTKPKKLPPGRVTKLYLPICTPQEYDDARTAELWLRTHCHPNRPWPPVAVQLIERYGELFEGQHARQLRCRQCLGLRYGEVKPAAKRLAKPVGQTKPSLPPAPAENGAKAAPARSNRIDALPKAKKEKLYLLFAEKLIQARGVAGLHNGVSRDATKKG
jgi:hypothetical protein